MEPHPVYGDKLRVVQELVPGKQITLADDFDAFQNPDLVQWKTYVQEKHLENDPQVRKCLQKIQSDYEGI